MNGHRTPATLSKYSISISRMLLLAAILVWIPESALPQCVPDANLSSVEPWDTYGQVFVVPGTGIGADVVTVTVLCAGSVPLPNAFVEIEFLDCDLCYWNGDHYITGFADGSGVFAYDPQVGGCDACEVRVTVEGVVIRSFTQVVSPDWDGVSGDGVVDGDDGAWFTPFISTNTYDVCADLNGDNAVDAVDGALLTPPLIGGASQPGCDSLECIESFTKTYTLDADFGLGTGNGVLVQNDQVQLSATGTTFQYAWIANSGEGTVSKVNTNTGNEVARYYTGPPNANNVNSYLSPSRTAVDEFGNCWVANRTGSGVASVTQILVTGGVDRNSNGNIETSMDASGDGIIQTSEMLAWGVDERVARHYSVGLQGNVARGLVIDKGGFLWVGLYNARRAVRLRTDLSTVTYAPGAGFSGPA